MMNKSVHYEEVSIIVTQALTDTSSGKLVTIPKGTVKVFDHLQTRTYKSYCYEFCGQYEIPLRKCKFSLGGKEFEMDRKVLDPCEIHVGPVTDSVAAGGIQQSLAKILATGLYSDLILSVKSERFKVHKGVLMARSPKLKTMLSSLLKEGHAPCINILSECSPEVFRKMLFWIYTGDCKMPDNVFESCKLLALADEYLLADLVAICEEDVLLKIDAENVVKILTQDGVGIPEKCEAKIFTECKNVLLSEFETIYEKDPDVEKKLTAVPGLITKILLHANDSKQLCRKSTGKIPKKKVRFNLSKSETATTPAESHEFMYPVAEYERSRSISQSDTQSVNSLFNSGTNGEGEMEAPEDEEENEVGSTHGSPGSPKNVGSLND